MHLRVPGLDEGMQWVGGEKSGMGGVLCLLCNPAHIPPTGHYSTTWWMVYPPKDDHAVVQLLLLHLRLSFTKVFRR